MKDHLYSNYISEEKINIGEIPALLFRTKNGEESLPTIIFYHGWSSSKESQRLRALLYATVGFQVLIPDAIYHGERNPIEYNLDNTKYFWNIILNNIDESDILIEELIKKYNGDIDNIFVAGNSMGGFTAAGVFTHNPKIKSLVVFNGSCAWKNSNELFKSHLNIEMTEELRKIERRIDSLDPLNNLELLKDRPILMLHGDRDSLVSIDSQRLFMKEIEPLYNHSNRIKLIEYPNLNHFVTTNMMEESIVWFKRF